MQRVPPADGRASFPFHWSGERLDSWKEIASFFHREVRTVQLWEKGEGLPIHRQHHKKLGSVYAYRRELEAWWIARSATNSGLQPHPVEVPASEVKLLKLQAHPEAALPRLLVLPCELIEAPHKLGQMRYGADRFADGLREELTVELKRSRFNPIFFPAKTFPALGTSSSSFVKNLAREFSANSLMRLSIRFSENQARISVQLIRAIDSTCIWADRFDVSLDNMFESQASVAHLIAAALPHDLVGSTTSSTTEDFAGNSPAYHARMMGQYFWNQQSEKALIKALGYYQDSVQLDPLCADGYAGLAETYISLSYNYLMPSMRAAALAQQAMETAIKLDSRSLGVQNSLINLQLCHTWDWPKALIRCMDLINSDTVDARTFQLSATVMSALGRHDEAINLSLHGLRMDDQLSALGHYHVAVAYFFAADYRSAHSFIKRSIELQPQCTMNYAFLARMEVECGNWSEAIDVCNRGLEVSSNLTSILPLLAYAHAGIGDLPKADTIVNQLKKLGPDECYPAYDISAVYAIQDKETEALQNIAEACNIRDMKTIFVRHDSRFAKMQHSLGFRQIADSFDCM